MRALTLHDVADLYEEWKERPPLREMVQAYLGIGKEQANNKPSGTQEELAQLAAMINMR